MERLATPHHCQADEPDVSIADVSDALAHLRAVHHDAASVVAELDLDDALLWRRAGVIVAEIAASTYELTARCAAHHAHARAAQGPPVVLVRQFATAQRTLFATLPRHPAHGRPHIAHVRASARRVRTLTDQLRQAVRDRDE